MKRGIDAEKQVALAEGDKDKQALKLVAGWRRSPKELGLN